VADLARRLAVARGDEPADVVVRGGRVLSVFTREWLDVDVAIADGWVAGLGEYDGTEVVDATGRYVVPGFIDAHMHLESSKLLPDEFARLVLPLGTTAVVADPHEIANVLGTDGVHWLLDASADIPLDVYFMASSSVPASEYESPRRALTEGDLEALLRRRRVLGIAEMMNFPGVVSGDAGELAKLALATHVDGHAPGVRGRALQAYAAAGIRSDHEASTLDEGRERLRAGMWLLVREASAARNLRTLLPLVAEYGPHRIAFCTDDREPEHIAEDGHINAMVRDAVDVRHLARRTRSVWRRTTRALPPARPPRRDRSRASGDLLSARRPRAVRAGARAEARQAGGRDPRASVPDWVPHTVRIGALGPEVFRIRVGRRGGARDRARAGQIITESLVDVPKHRGGEAVADPERDLAKIAVIERHLGTGRSGLGFVRGSVFAVARSARRSRTTRTTRSSSGWTTRRWRSPCAGWRISAAASSSLTAASCWPSSHCPWRESSPTPRSRRSSRRARRSWLRRASSAARSRRRSSCSRSWHCR
jgi:adenine deaminase